jgi:hypothetical protein
MCALGEETHCQNQARSLANVVRVGLKREAEKRDCAAAEAPEMLSQLPDDSPLLQLVDFDHGR